MDVNLRQVTEQTRKYENLNWDNKMRYEYYVSVRLIKTFDKPQVYHNHLAMAHRYF